MSLALSSSSSLSIKSLAKLSSENCISQILSTTNQTPSPIIPNTNIANNVNIHNYLLANPSYFLANPEFALKYGVKYEESMTIVEYVTSLPVIYVAETHSEYGNITLRH